VCRITTITIVLIRLLFRVCVCVLASVCFLPSIALIQNNLYCSTIFLLFRIRSNGSRGADVETLRGTTGSDFEGIGTIVRVAEDQDLCGCCFVFRGGQSDANIERLLLIKGPFVFVYAISNHTSPKYAISLESLVPSVKDNDTNTILLQTSLGETQYEIRFQNNEDAVKFKNVVTEQSAIGRNNATRTKIGHGHLLNKRSSVKYAEEIALNKYILEQPSEPITTKDVIDTMATAPGL
jgi:hypothetical protein